MNQRPAQTAQQQPQVIIVQQKSSNGCLITALVYLLFGWLGLAVMAAWKLTKLAWNLFIAWPVKWSWRATVALTRWSWQGAVALSKWGWPAVVVLSREGLRGVRAFHARYGARGWAIVGGVGLAAAVALTVLAVVVSAFGGGSGGH